MPTGADALAEIARGRVAPVYFLCGEERFLVERTIAALREEVLGKARDLNYDLLVAKDAGAAGVVSAARTVPMLGGKRLVLVREADALVAKELEALLPYLRDPNPATCLVLVGEKADLRTKFFSEIDKRGLLVRFDPIREREAPNWVRAEAKAMGVAIDPDAVALLVESVGADLGQLASALERLALYVGTVARVGAHDVEAVVVQARSRSVFELCEAAFRADLRRALVVLGRMIEDRERPTGIVAMLARHVRQVWSVRELAAARASEGAIAERLGIRPFFVRPLVEQARRFTAKSLRRAHETLVATDRALKSSKLDEERIMELCVLKLVACAATPRGDSRRA
ncbi:MAG: DNA polymerase III subunit delta [Myxococcota bacterium]